MTPLRWGILAALGVALLAQAEPGVTIKAVDLKAQPASDARTVAPVAANTTVDVLKREGAWVQLKAGNTTGWAKLFDVRLNAAGAASAPAKGSSGNTIAQTLGLAAGTRPASVSTGVRGLDADMLARATPNPQELAAMEGYASTKQQASVFAREGRLESRTLAPVTGEKK